ncbi:hypothetical protein NDU88_002530 [Pleurodeles waltl]|uniref:Uncharacterized protein n=1 Tax=Pleurodeles waltl TaxID=8319 RepID=A0AAV7QA66_PLEWA|nr:hypothetical protein NDU88_002530 [Pleurodeles waltl]
MGNAAARGRAAGEAAARFKGRSTRCSPFLRPQVPGQARQDRRPRIGSRSLQRSAPAKTDVIAIIECIYNRLYDTSNDIFKKFCS